MKPDILRGASYYCNKTRGLSLGPGAKHPVEQAVLLSLELEDLGKGPLPLPHQPLQIVARLPVGALGKWRLGYQHAYPRVLEDVHLE